MALDYDKTLNLPKTDFPMRAGLPKQEPKMLEKWEKEGLYNKIIEQTKEYPTFVFHDGPPYANAAIHLGTALNKVLKDFIVRSKNMTGRHTPYIPGWDTHGLPIELKAIEEYGVEITKDPIVLRKHCHDFALEHVETQKEQFKRLGTIADYDNPYLTLAPEYEAEQIKVFGSMAENEYIYKDLKPGYWCAECVTALAEAEIEYADDNVDSIYVKFQIVEDDNKILEKMGSTDLSKTFVVIWTTTTWTLPANQAVSLHPDLEYTLVKVNDEFLLMARDLVMATMATAGFKEEDYEILGIAKGSDLEFVKYKHPFLDRVSPIITGEHVTLEAGTGAVHTAPGHGDDDFRVVTVDYKDHFKDGILVPVDETGRMTKEAGDWLEGVTTYKANRLISEYLTENNFLFSTERITHQYPHCWRCKKPILFRATEQWFISLDGFKEETLKEIEKVEFIPSWGKQRMHSMVADRESWTISRQRAWGVPIPIFYCNDCDKHVVNKETIEHISNIFEKEGSDSWFIRSEKELLPDGFTCPHCSGSSFTKETDTMDVWYDSGCSHASVMDKRQHTPADLYLEGGDQYRGWFQSSLLTSVAWKGRAPYKSVCTHGMVVDDKGRKQSKSLGNGIAPEEIIEKYGADILRLWVASSDYHSDIRVSDKILGQLAEAYRKIRNTARYMLSNLSDFNPNTDMIPSSKREELDRWAVAEFQNVLKMSKNAYDTYDFHLVYHGILNFCTTDMSNFYLDIIKDRLYVEKEDGHLRRSAQSAMYEILHGLTLMLAPVLSFTCEEIWSYMEHLPEDNTEYAVLNQMPKVHHIESEDFMNRWEQFKNLRDVVNKALEEARNNKELGKSLEAKVVIQVGGDLYTLVKNQDELLKSIFIVSQVEILKNDDFKDEANIKILLAEGEKCERCWVVSTTVGENKTHPTLCSRCANILE